MSHCTKINKNASLKILILVLVALSSVFSITLGGINASAAFVPDPKMPGQYIWVENAQPKNVQIQKIQNTKGFDPNVIISDEEVARIPSKFDSVQKIQEYLERNQSFLAKYEVNIDMEADSSIFSAKLNNKPEGLNTTENIGGYVGKKIIFSEFVWKLSTQDFGNGCSLNFPDICINNRTNPISPAFYLAKVQKESGLIYGINAKLDPNSDRARFLLDRMTGYTCNESPDKSKSCFDENPEWTYFKGPFKQLYYTSRMLRLTMERCLKMDIQLYSRTFRVGSDVDIWTANGTQTVKLNSKLACSFYIYTPNMEAQQLYKEVYDSIVS